MIFFNKTSLALAIKQQHENFKKAGITVPIKVTKREEGSKECLNWVLQNKEGKMLHNLNPQDMEEEYAWFFKSPWLWNNSKIHIVTCDIKTLANLVYFNLPFEHEYQVETIGDYILTE